MLFMILKTKPNLQTHTPMSGPKNLSCSMSLHAIHVARFDPL